MQAAYAQLRASAHNVANLATRGEDLARNVVTQLAAKNAFLANLAVFKTRNQLAGARFDESA